MPIIALTVIHVVRPDRVEPRRVVNGEVRVTQPPNDQVALKLVCKNGAPPPNPAQKQRRYGLLIRSLSCDVYYAPRPPLN